MHPQYLYHQKEILIQDGASGECTIILVLFEASLQATSLEAIYYIVIQSITFVQKRFVFPWLM